jgi:hypothetical protein
MSQLPPDMIQPGTLYRGKVWSGSAGRNLFKIEAKFSNISKLIFLPENEG